MSKEGGMEYRWEYRSMSAMNFLNSKSLPTKLTLFLKFAFPFLTVAMVVATSRLLTKLQPVKRPKHVSYYKFVMAVTFLVIFYYRVGLDIVVKSHYLRKAEGKSLIHDYYQFQIYDLLTNYLLRDATFVALCATFFGMSNEDFKKNTTDIINKERLLARK